MTKNTLTKILFGRITALILLIVVAIGFIAFEAADAEIDSIYDAELVNTANTLWWILKDDLDANEPINDSNIEVNDELLNQHDRKAFDQFAKLRMFRIWRDGKIVMHSDNALPETVNSQQHGLHNIHYNTKKWRMYTLDVPQYKIKVEVGERERVRFILIDNIALALTIPLLLLVPIAGFLVWFTIGNSLKSLKAVINQVHLRSPNDLSRLMIENTPRDLVPLTESINQLLSKLERSFLHERRFTDQVAHQIRTPLAVLKLQLQLAMREKSFDEVELLMKQMLQSVNGASHLIDQLLTIARLDFQQFPLAPLSLKEEISRIIESINPLIKEKNITVSYDYDAVDNINSNEALIKLIISNIIDNAVKYSPLSGHIKIKAANNNGNVIINISDSGSGIKEEDRHNVIKRFYRGASEIVPGSGLGLAIVAEAVEVLKGSISFNNSQEDSGLVVTINLPKMN